MLRGVTWRSRARDRLNGVRWRLHAIRRVLRPGARPEMALIGPRPPRFIKPVHVGRIDSPRRGAALREGTLAIRGWTCFSQGRVRRAEVYLGEEHLGPARVGVPRPDVAEVIDYPHAPVSGFELILPVEAAQRFAGSGSTEVRVLVTGVNGATFEPDPVEVKLFDAVAGAGGSPQPDAGHIDAPIFRAEISDTLVVQGWACLADGAARRAEIWLGDEILGRARVGVPRPDLADVLDRPEAVLAGFELAVDADEARRLVGAGETMLRVLVTGITGRTFEPAPVPIEILEAAPREAEEPPAVGVIDSPVAGAEIGAGTMSVRGWACFAAGHVRCADVYLGEEALGQARIGVPRPELEANSRHPQAALGGFELTVDADAARAIAGVGETEVRVVVRDTEGRTYEPPSVGVRLAPADAVAAVSPTRVDVSAPRTRNGPRTLVVTHQLTLGGAQLFLMDLLSGMTALDAIDPVVVSSLDGPLRARLEADGIPVHLTDLQPAGTLGSHLGRIDEFLAWAEPLGFDLVLVNTATSAAFAGGEIATRLGIPSVWTIHESFEPALLWGDLKADVRAHAEMVIANASLAIFEADATRRIYQRLVDPDRCLVLPYGLALEPIDAQRADFDREAARRAAGIPSDALLIVCVGSVEPRKAQVPLAEAFDLVAEQHPRARLTFVGGKAGDPNTMALEAWIAGSPLADRVELIPITPDVGEWYGMADLLVCASDVESLPRTVLEAMAWETPVLATSVFGLPELIADGETGWLCEPRDTFALAEALSRALAAPESTRARIARDARELVENRHSLPRYAERVAELLETTVADRPEMSALGAGR